MLTPSSKDYIVVTESQIQGMVGRLAQQIDQHYKDENIERFTLVPLLTGAIYFAADLSREISLVHKVHAVKVTSYIGKESHTLQHSVDVSTDYTGEHILLCDEIYDSGTTLNAMKKVFLSLGAASVKTVSLIDRYACRSPKHVNDVLDFKGVDIQDKSFLYGYGLDLDGYYRECKHIMALVQ